ncbi:relaxase/mobilization nuclease domain-containing protein, partial [Desulfovibrio cuneatus]|uniref:relaxase/mobilization nuclease domain-containing protein n=1 Tax=Desulfovibrio cuneatus TaxID=159728 RepID=UPI0004814D2A
MYMKVFPHGQGGGAAPIEYLLRLDYPDREANPPTVLRGNPEQTRALIDSLETVWRFTAGTLSWHPDDAVTTEMEERVMDDFEAVAFAGLAADQRNILWVRHAHAGHHELHFVIPRVELSSGKAFNPCPPGWQKPFDVFRDLHNHREGWARPDDPARIRPYAPEHTDLHRARLIRWGAIAKDSPDADPRSTAKKAIHDYILAGIEDGRIGNRADVVQALKDAGFAINRAGKDYITVAIPAEDAAAESSAPQPLPPRRRKQNSRNTSKRSKNNSDTEENTNTIKLRLKGGMYAEHWNFTHLTGRTVEGQDRAGTTRDGEPDPATIQRLERELAAIIAKRAEYNRGRYPAPA